MYKEEGGIAEKVESQSYVTAPGRGGVTNLYPLVSVAHHGNEEINQNNHSDYLIDTKRDNKHFLCPLWLAEFKFGDGCRGGRQVGCHLFERTYWYKCCGCQ